MTKQSVESLIIKSLHELDEVLDYRIIGPVDSKTRIFGPEGILDSLGLLVTVITYLEKALPPYLRPYAKIYLQPYGISQ